MILFATAVGGLYALLLPLADAGTFRGVASSENQKEANGRGANARRLNLFAGNDSRGEVELAALVTGDPTAGYCNW